MVSVLALVKKEESDMPEHNVRQRILQWLPMVFFVVAVLILIMSLGFLFIAMGDAQHLTTTAPTAANDFHLEQLEHQIAELSDELERAASSLEEELRDLIPLNSELADYAKFPSVFSQIRVDGTVYILLDKPLSIRPEDADSTGRIASIVPGSKTPTEDNQANNAKFDGQPYVWIDGQLYLHIPDEGWHLCAPSS